MPQLANSLEFIRASALTLEAFAQVYSRSFEDYFYPMTQTAEGFAARIRAEQLDLYHSAVMLANGESAGQATIGLRDQRAWCGGFGIVPAWRGAGLGSLLFNAFLARAREAGATHLVLEALARNIRALSVYTNAGMQVTRDLLLLEWAAPTQEGLAMRTTELDGNTVWTVINVAALLQHHARLHPVPACWSRDVASLLVRRGLRGLGLGDPNYPDAYILFDVRDDGIGIYDLGALDVQQAAVLLRMLQGSHKKMRSVNEPADSPLTQAFLSTGFRETDRQHELALLL